MRILILSAMIALVLHVATPSLAAPTSRPAPASQPDPSQATHREGEVIGATPATAFGELGTLCLTVDGRLLAGDTGKSEIRAYSAEHKLLDTWKPGLKPHAIYACPDGTVYAGGVGQLAKLDKDGKVVKSVAASDAGLPSGKVSSITATDADVFISIGSGGSLGARAVIIRLDRDLGGAKTIATDQRGCCQRLDMKVQDGVLYVAENARHRVVKFDRDGKVLGTWGRQHRKDLAGFGSCCNPMNLWFGSDGALYTAESGLGRVKRYDTDGRFLGLVGFVDVPQFTTAGGLAASCSNIAVAASDDGKRVYVQDVKKNVIRVLVADEGKGGTTPSATAQSKESSK